VITAVLGFFKTCADPASHLYWNTEKEIGVRKKYTGFLKKFFIGRTVCIICVKNSNLAIVILEHSRGGNVRELCAECIISRIGMPSAVTITFRTFYFSGYMINAV
jgi:hypothetical protein